MEADDWKPMPSIGAGVREIRIHLEGEEKKGGQEKRGVRCEVFCRVCFDL
jgi:phage-related protein